MGSQDETQISKARAAAPTIALAVFLTLSFVPFDGPLVLLPESWSIPYGLLWIGSGGFWLLHKIRHRGAKKRAQQTESPRSHGKAIPGWRSFLVTALAVWISAAALGFPGQYHFNYLIGIFVLVVLMGIWLVRGIVALGGGVSGPIWLRWLVQPALIAILIALSSLDVPSRLAYSASEDDVEATAQMIIDSYVDLDKDAVDRVGLYEVIETEYDYANQIVKFTILGDFTSSQGFCYAGGASSCEGKRKSGRIFLWEEVHD